MSTPRLSIVLPCYNPPPNWLDAVILHYAELKSINGDLGRDSIELLIVNDGSSQGFNENEVREVFASNTDVRIISYDKNKGKGYALRRGVKEARGSIIVYTDIDFPYTDQSFDNIYAALKNGSDLAIGIRRENYYTHLPKTRVRISKLLRLFIRKFLRIPTDDTQCGLKGFNQKGKEIFLQTTIDRYLFDLEFIFLAARKKLSIRVVEVELREGIMLSSMRWKILLQEFGNFLKILVTKLLLTMNYKISEKYPQKRAFITGGGGGLGRGLSLKLAADGWNVGIADIKQEGLDETAQLIEKAGGKAIKCKFDVSNKVEYKKAFDDFISKLGGIDLLVNNAGVGDGGLVGEYSLENWDWITGINLMAAVYGSHYAIPIMKAQKSGYIISTASAAGFANMPNMSQYNVTKAGVISLMETIYAEVKAFNIGASVVCPTFFRSDIMQHHRGDNEAAAIGQTIIQRAKFSADEIADYILIQAGKNKFLILHPYQAKLVYHLKRFFPTFFLNTKAKRFATKDWVQEALKQRF